MKKTNKTTLWVLAGVAAFFGYRMWKSKQAATTTTTGKDKFANGYEHINPADLTAEKEVIINTAIVDKTK